MYKARVQLSSLSSPLHTHTLIPVRISHGGHCQGSENNNFYSTTIKDLKHWEKKRCQDLFHFHHKITTASNSKWNLLLASCNLALLSCLLHSPWCGGGWWRSPACRCWLRPAQTSPWNILHPTGWVFILFINNKMSENVDTILTIQETFMRSQILCTKAGMVWHSLSLDSLSHSLCYRLK